MKVIGLSAYFHDSSAALVIDGKVVAAAQEERFTNIKHDSGLPLQAVRFCLDYAGLTIDEIDHIVFYEKPLQRFERLLVTHLAEFPKGGGQFVSSIGRWLSRRLWMKNEWVRELGCRADQILCSEHHLSHASAAFLHSPYETAAIVTADGVGEWVTTSIYRGITDSSGSRIEKLQELIFPHSIGLLYAAVTAYLGFEVNEGEQKTMGLAAFGAPVSMDAFRKLVRLERDGSFTLDLDYFAFTTDTDMGFSPKLETMLGPRRDPAKRWDLARASDVAYANVAASLQAITEEAMLGLARRARERTGLDA